MARNESRVPSMQCNVGQMRRLILLGLGQKEGKLKTNKKKKEEEETQTTPKSTENLKCTAKRPQDGRRGQLESAKRQGFFIILRRGHGEGVPKEQKKNECRSRRNAGNKETPTKSGQ